jgi:hypothetical protein
LIPDAPNVALELARRKRDRKAAIAAFLAQLGIRSTPFAQARLGQSVSFGRLDVQVHGELYRARRPRGVELN